MVAQTQTQQQTLYQHASEPKAVQQRAKVSSRQGAHTDTLEHTHAMGGGCAWQSRAAWVVRTIE